MRELTAAEISELREKNPYDIAHVFVPGLGSVVVCAPTQGDFDRWQRRSNGTKKVPGDPRGANEELVTSCLIEPTIDELRAAIELRRKHGLWQALTGEIVALSGALVEAASGN